MPLCYGGGVSNLEQALKIFSLGVEKIAISTAAINNATLINEIASKVGNQSVVVVLDVKKKLFSNNYEVYRNNGTESTGYDLVEYVKRLESEGAGEIVLNSVELDGTMVGYDLNLIKIVRDSVDIPITILGGAGSLQNFGEVITNFGVMGLAAGSMFVFKGRFKAVLISYPTPEERIELVSKLKQ
jgi:cyclase